MDIRQKPENLIPIRAVFDAGELAVPNQLSYTTAERLVNVGLLKWAQPTINGDRRRKGFVRLTRAGEKLAFQQPPQGEQECTDMII